MTNDDSPETILSNVVAVLEEHNKIFLQHRQVLEKLSKEVAEINQKLKSMEQSANSIDPSDAKFLADITARLKNVSRAVDEKSLKD